jgi:hypothetical protein
MMRVFPHYLDKINHKFCVGIYLENGNFKESCYTDTTDNYFTKHLLDEHRIQLQKFGQLSIGFYENSKLENGNNYDKTLQSPKQDK